MDIPDRAVYLFFVRAALYLGGKVAGPPSLVSSLSASRGRTGSLWEVPGLRAWAVSGRIILTFTGLQFLDHPLKQSPSTASTPSFPVLSANSSDYC